MWNSILSKTKNSTQKIAEEMKGLSEKGIEQIVNEGKEKLNGYIERVALLIVTTCIIPLSVFFVGIWIVKTLLNIPMPELKLPKSSKILKKDKELSN